MENPDIVFPSAKTARPLDLTQDSPQSPPEPAELSPFNCIPDEMILRIIYIAAETDPPGYLGPDNDIDSPPSLGPVAEGASQVCQRWHGVIQGVSNELLWHFGVRLDLQRSHGRPKEPSEIFHFKQRLVESQGYSLYVTIGGFPQLTGRLSPEEAHLALIGLRLLEPYYFRITSFSFINTFPPLNPHSVAFNSYPRLQSLLIQYSVAYVVDPSTLDPHDIISFLYSADSPPIPLKTVSKITLYDVHPRTWLNLPTGPSVRRLILSTRVPFHMPSVRYQDLGALILANPNLCALEIKGIDLIWEERTLPNARTPLNVEELTIKAHRDISLYLLLAFTFDRLVKCVLDFKGKSRTVFHPGPWTLPSFPFLQHISIKCDDLRDHFQNTLWRIHGRIDAPLLRSLNLAPEDWAMGAVSLTLCFAWVRLFFSPKLQELTLRMSKEGEEVRFLATIRCPGGLMSAIEKRQTYFSSAHSAFKADHGVSFDISVDFLQVVWRRQFLGLEPGQVNESVSRITQKILEELDSEPKENVLLPTLDSLIVRLSGAFLKVEFVATVEDQLRSLKASRIDRGFSIANVVLVDQGRPKNI
jgi:hypothetical protein